MQATFEHDVLGRITEFSTPTGATFVASYAPSGFLESITTKDDAGTPIVVSEYTYDPVGRITSVTQTAGGTVRTYSMTYDARGRLLSRTDPLGAVQTFAYDFLGAMTSYTDKAGRTSTWTYDAAGRLTGSTNRAGEAVVWSYDLAGRVDSITAPGVSRTFEYDPLGRTIVAASDGYAIQYAYDKSGATFARTSGPGPSPSIEWNVERYPSGQASRVRGPAINSGPPLQDTQYRYDAFGALVELTEEHLGSFSWSFDSDGRGSSLRRPTGLTTNASYDDGNNLVSLQTAGHQDDSYTYGADGLLQSYTDAQGTHVVSRDDARRVSGVQHEAPTQPETYAYDPAGNRTSWSGHPEQDVQYGANGQLLRDATYDYEYDEEGRRTTRTARLDGATTVYLWDGIGQLRGIDLPDASTLEYDYDAFGRRVAIRHISPGGNVLRSHHVAYDLSDQVRLIYDTETESVHSEYVAGPRHGEVLARRRPGIGVDYALRDRQNTVLYWVDENGTQTQPVLRDAFGARIAGGPELFEPYGFTGHTEDETGLVWGRARYYDPAAGAWLSEDAMLTEPQYSYVGGRVYDAIDVTGASYIEGLLYYNHRAEAYQRLGARLQWATRTMRELGHTSIALRGEAQRLMLGWESYLTPTGAAVLKADAALAQTLNAMVLVAAFDLPESLARSLEEIAAKYTALNIKITEASNAEQLERTHFTGISPPSTTIASTNAFPIGGCGAPTASLIATIPPVQYEFATQISNLPAPNTDFSVAAGDCGGNVSNQEALHAKACGGNPACSILIPMVFPQIDSSTTCATIDPHLLSETKHTPRRIGGRKFGFFRTSEFEIDADTIVPTGITYADTAAYFAAAEQRIASQGKRADVIALLQKATPDGATFPRYFVFALKYTVDWKSFRYYSPTYNPPNEINYNTVLGGNHCFYGPARVSIVEHERMHGQAAQAALESAELLFTDGGDALNEDPLSFKFYVGSYDSRAVKEEGTLNSAGDTTFPERTGSFNKTVASPLSGTQQEILAALDDVAVEITTRLFEVSDFKSVVEIDYPRSCKPQDEKGGIINYNKSGYTEPWFLDAIELALDPP